ncbi:MAG: hypothetical protein QXY18_07160 [Nitrososphaerota archaeon]
MAEQLKYYIISFKIRNGEDEYFLTGYTKASSIEKAEKTAEKYLKDFFGIGTNVDFLGDRKDIYSKLYWNADQDKVIKVDSISEYSTLDEKTLTAANVIKLH